MKVHFYIFLMMILLSISTQAQDIAGVKNEKALLWEIRSEEGMTSWIFGTSHLLCKDDFFLPDSFSYALEYAEELVFEIDMNDPAEFFQMAAAYVMKGDTLLQDLYDSSDWVFLSSFFLDSLDIPLADYDNWKPILLSTVILLKIMHCPMLTYEFVIAEMAAGKNKSISGLESVKEQANILDRIPYCTQAEYLMEWIRDIDNTKKESNTISALYKDQDIDALAGLMGDNNNQLSEFEALLLWERNEKWSEKIRTEYQDKSVLICVGAGHLGGEKGLLNALRGKGYQVEPLP